ncbi:glycosyltransferase [bacterium]|nr:glycosyltransferase [bacterium]
MKICIICPDGLSTIIFCKTPSKLFKNEFSDEVITISSIDNYREEIKSLKTKHYDVSMARYISVFKDIIYCVKIYNILKNNTPNCLITFTTKPNIYCHLLAKRLGIPIRVMAVRGLGQNFSVSQNWKSKCIKYLVRKLYQCSCNLTTNIWFTNPNDKKLFLENNFVSEQKSVITRNAVDLDFWDKKFIDHGIVNKIKSSINWSNEKFYVILVGRLIWEKGIKEFCEVSNLLLNSKAHFILVAPKETNSQNSVPINYVHEFTKNDNFTYIEFTKHIREWYYVINLSVLPSYYQEGGYPRALLEAMALEKPVIAADTPHCRMPVEINKNGFLVKTKDTIDLKNKIEKFLVNPDMEISFGINSRQIIEDKFDDKHVFREIRNVIGFKHDK